jgi:hypothetical protein
MRIILAVVVCWSCASSSSLGAAMRVSIGGVGRQSSGPIVPPLTGILIAEHRDAAMPSVSWTTPNIEPNAWDDWQVRTWTLDDQNASQFGVNWSDFETAVLQQDSYRFKYTIGNSPNQLSNGGWSGFRFTHLDRVELEIPYYAYSPVVSGYRGNFYLVGTGFEVPEPASQVQLALGVFFGLVVPVLGRLTASKLPKQWWYSSN